MFELLKFLSSGKVKYTLAKSIRRYIKMVKMNIANLKLKKTIWRREKFTIIKPASNCHYTFLNNVIAKTHQRK